MGKFGTDIQTSMQEFNNDFDTGWTMGTNWDNKGTEFETYVNKYLFPKLNETALVNVKLGNRFDFLAKEKDFIGQYSEEYVIKDSVPVSLVLSKPATLMFERNYPQMITKLFGQGVIKKQKFTLNNNDARFNFSTIADAVGYAMGVYTKRISDINVLEELEIKGMLVDYALNHTTEKRPVTSLQELDNKLFETMLNLQNNSSRYNESAKASGGAIGRYTTTTKLSDVVILTTDEIKTYLLNTKIANTFNAEGLDLSKKIISFDTLGGCFRMTEDVKITTPETLEFFKAYGDYQIALNDTVLKGMVITFDVSNLEEFKGKCEEIKPKTDIFAYVFDINKLRYERYTKGMLKKPWYDRENDEYTHWLHYYSRKNVSPFYNNVLLEG